MEKFQRNNVEILTKHNMNLQARNTKNMQLFLQTNQQGHSHKAQRI